MNEDEAGLEDPRFHQWLVWLLAQPSNTLETVAVVLGVSSGRYIDKMWLGHPGMLPRARTRTRLRHEIERHGFSYDSPPPSGGIAVPATAEDVPPIETWIPEQRKGLAGDIWLVLLQLSFALGGAPVSTGQLRFTLSRLWGVPPEREGELTSCPRFTQGQRALTALVSRGYLEQPVRGEYALTVAGWWRAFTLIFGSELFAEGAQHIQSRLGEGTTRATLRAEGERIRDEYDREKRTK